MEEMIPYMDEYTKPGQPSCIYMTTDDIVDITTSFESDNPVVLFISHPADHEKLLLPHVQELAGMKRDFITVWNFHDGMWDHPDDIDADIYLWLSDVDAVIMMVTSEFMDQPGYAGDLVLPSAMELKTPILAVLCEEELEERFRAAYPRVPYIFDKGIRQDGGIPYKALMTMFVEGCKEWNLEETLQY